MLKKVKYFRNTKTATLVDHRWADFLFSFLAHIKSKNKKSYSIKTIERKVGKEDCLIYRHTVLETSCSFIIDQSMNNLFKNSGVNKCL